MYTQTAVETVRRSNRKMRRKMLVRRVKATLLLALMLGVAIGVNVLLAHLDAQRMPGMEKAVAAEAARIDARAEEWK